MSGWGYLYNETAIRYHIHVNVHLGRRDGKNSSLDDNATQELKTRLGVVGLKEDSFLPGGSGYESSMHLTGKFTDKTVFDQTRSLTTSILKANPHLYVACYQEDEAIPVDMSVGYRPYCNDLEFPFSLSFAENIPDVYKAAELHMSARDRELVDKHVDSTLQSAGFCVAYLPKPEGTIASVYTATGELECIQRLAKPTYEWLRDTGGFPKGSVKVEVMIGGIQVFGEPVIEFMPLISSVEFHNPAGD